MTWAWFRFSVKGHEEILHVLDLVPCGNVVVANLGNTGDDMLDGFLDCFTEITTAIALSNRISGFSVYRADDTTSCHTQWRIDDPSSFTYHKANTFTIDRHIRHDISELKEACQESIVEDINSTNVLARLQYATPYQLPKLKTGCMTYLVKFGKIFDIWDEFTSFEQTVDRLLVAEIFNEVLREF